VGGLDDGDDKRRGYVSVWLGVFVTGLIGVLDKWLTMLYSFTIML